MLVSEFVDGRLLQEFLAAQSGRRLQTFEALHLLYALACAVGPIHARGEYHGDLHDGNVLVKRAGLGFDIKLIDIYHRDQRKSLNIQDDVWDMIKIFYDALGASRFYSKQRKEIKAICLGLKRAAISKKFRNANMLRDHLETMVWSD